MIYGRSPYTLILIITIHERIIFCINYYYGNVRCRAVTTWFSAQGKWRPASAPPPKKKFKNRVKSLGAPSATALVVRKVAHDGGLRWAFNQIGLLRPEVNVRTCIHPGGSFFLLF